MFRYPSHVKKTAVWLYTAQELSGEEVARRLEVSSSIVWEWIDAVGLLRTKKASQELYYRARHPELYEKQLRAFTLREQGLSQKAVADIMDISITSVYRYEKRIRTMRKNEHRIKVRKD